MKRIDETTNAEEKEDMRVIYAGIAVIFVGFWILLWAVRSGVIDPHSPKPQFAYNVVEVKNTINLPPINNFRDVLFGKHLWVMMLGEYDTTSDFGFYLWNIVFVITILGIVGTIFGKTRGGEK